jgi:hypothetical protein
MQTSLFWSSLGRAFAHIWHPRMLLLTLLPFAICLAVGGLLSFLYWEGAVAAVRDALQGSSLLTAAFGWLEWIGLHDARAVLAPLIVVALAVPLLVVLALLVTSIVAMPAALRFVAERRFAALERRGRAALLQSAAMSLGWTLVALAALIVSIPLWFVPPFFFVLPPLIWGWLTYKVMSFEALAEHASADERRQVIHQHRTALLVLGIATGLIGAAPSLLWVGSAMTVILFPLISLASLWLYTAGFVFTALWFAHYCLAALADLRGQQQALDAALPSVG